MWKNFLMAPVVNYGVEGRYLLSLKSSGIASGISVW